MAQDKQHQGTTGETAATCSSKSAVERRVMPDDEAMKWAWEQVKNDCDLHNLTVGESSTYFGFFVWGWNYRAQLEKQEDLLEAKAKHYQKACSEIGKTLEGLIAEWEVEGDFLDNDHDTQYDRAVGQTYKKCASELRKAFGV